MYVRCATHVCDWHRQMNIQFCHFLKLLSILVCRCQCRVWCLCLCQCFLSYPSFWPNILHSYTLWSGIFFDFSKKIWQKGILKYLIFVPIRTLFSLYLYFFNLLLSFKISSFINSLLFLILILVLILILISHFSFFYFNHFYFSFY